MTNEEAIKDIEENILPVVGGKSLRMAIEALETQGYAAERYVDLCGHFDGCSDKGAAILHDRNEFKAWLERMRWHVRECDRLARELDALKAQDAPDTNVGSKGGDTIYRQAAIDLVEGLESARLKGEIDLLYPKLVKGLIGLPSAQAEQPEIIRCKDCKYRDPEDRKCDCGHDILWQLPRQDDWYCADAERRTDE